MSLRVWLPLNGSLENKGLDDITPLLTGAVTVDNKGKIGKCYKFGTSLGRITIPPATMRNYTECSITFWVNILGWQSNWDTFFQAGLGTAPWNSYIFGVLRNFGNSVVFTISDSSSSSQGNYKSSDLTLNTWYHLGFTYKSGHCCIYVNGNLYKDYSTNIIPNFSGINYISLGQLGNASNYQTNCKMNDFRIYDHALSPLEIKEISKGLILHYLLNRNGLGPTNLLKNGFGELGIENWGYAGGMFSDVPKNHPEIYHSYKNVESKEFIPIYRNHSYKFSTWIKTTASSGNSYPSICPYDVDKLFIATNNCKEGFDLKTMTVLTRELKAGDTKIYVEDLSKWNANSGHYYDTAAIFSYKDGTGYIWPDGVYTRNCPAFSSGTEAKTNLDKTNNIITLLTAYNGVTMPVGTKVCASAYGNTYFYPCGGIPYSTITNWTFKENTFSSETPRLSAAKYIRVLTYSNCYQAGMTVTDLTMESFNNNIEYDTSGYCNNGIRIGTFSWTSDTPKYQVSTKFDTTSTKIKLPVMSFTGMANSYTFAWWQYNTSTGNMPWGFSDGNRLNCYHCSPLCWNTGDGSSNQFKDGSTTIAPSILQNDWHHMVITGDGIATKLYIDGIYKGTATTYKPLTGTQIWISGWDSGTSYTFKESKECDFRIYATALSADDVKSLYNNSAYIDSQGNIYGAVYEEV